MKILVFGSFNIDRVYTLSHLPARGETLSCEKYEIHVGGKGLNQALAFRKAGAQVIAAGKIGADGTFLADYLEKEGVDVSFVDRTAAFSGHAVIEVDPDGQNQMVIFGGANREITPDYCDRLLAAHGDAALLLTQYETSCVDYMLARAKAAGIRTAMNPSPFTEALLDFPYENVDVLILNESEGAAISGETAPEKIARALQRMNRGEVVLTLGAAGAIYCDGARLVREPAMRAKAVDTTGAGDTFTGYSLFSLLSGADPRDALRTGAAASAIEVTRPGAAEAIPARAEVLRFLAAHEA